MGLKIRESQKSPETSETKSGNLPNFESHKIPIKNIPPPFLWAHPPNTFSSPEESPHP